MRNKWLIRLQAPLPGYACAGSAPAATILHSRFSPFMTSSGTNTVGNSWNSALCACNGCHRLQHKGCEFLHDCDERHSFCSTEFAVHCTKKPKVGLFQSDMEGTFLLTGAKTKKSTKLSEFTHLWMEKCIPFRFELAPGPTVWYSEHFFTSVGGSVVHKPVSHALSPKCNVMQPDSIKICSELIRLPRLRLVYLKSSETFGIVYSR